MLSIFLLIYGFTASVHTLLKLIIITFGFLLLLFLVKGFFRKQKAERSLTVEIEPDEQPRFFDFIDQLCDELGVTYPRKVFVSFEVNAAASLGTSLWDFVWPTGRDLYIGFGLINMVNLTEFKAILAHEFGHFGQGGMKLSGYAYLTKRVTQNLFYGQDWIDELVARWCHGGTAMALIGWPLFGFFWAFRMLFLGLFLPILFLEKAMSKEMEFHADRVAVSVTGSDAIVHGLKHSFFAGECMQRALYDLAQAADRGVYTDDMFVHQTAAAGYLRQQANNPNLGEPPPLPPDPNQKSYVFDPKDEEDYPAMWADHPPNYEREDSAKEIYIRSYFDDRSPWVLFDNLEELKEYITYRTYRVLFRAKKNIRMTPADKVLAGIDSEHEELTYNAGYHGTYDHRRIDPGDMNALCAEMNQNPWPVQQVVQTYQEIYFDRLKNFSPVYLKHLKDMEFLHEVSNDGDTDFEFRGKEYYDEDLDKLFKRVNKELRKDHEYLWQIDRLIFLMHYRMALEVSQSYINEMMERYAFHLRIQDSWSIMQEERFPVGFVLARISSGGEFSKREYKKIFNILRDAHLTVKKVLKDSETMYLPALSNIERGDTLRRHLLKKNLVDGLTRYDYFITAKWINKFLNQFEEVQGRLESIHFKSLGSLLTLQETIAKRCFAKWNINLDLNQAAPQGAPQQL